jgi:hypothetical protein
MVQFIKGDVPLGGDSFGPTATNENALLAIQMAALQSEWLSKSAFSWMTYWLM